MWFNPGELLKNKTDTLANSANPANYESKNKADPPCYFCYSATFEGENSKTEAESSKVAKVADPLASENLIVTCYTPNGKPIEVEATSQEHADWLLKMNPKPEIIGELRAETTKPLIVTCYDCSHFKSFNAHGGGAGLCSIGVWTAGHSRWAGDMHQCSSYKAKVQAI